MFVFTSVVVFEGTHWYWLTPPKALYTKAREFEYDVMVRPPPPLLLNILLRPADQLFFPESVQQSAVFE